MSSRFLNKRSVRATALAVCAGVIGSFAMTAPAMAAAPASGAACQASDGKISGRGSTLQGGALSALITGYTNDVCGPVAAQYTGDPATTSMIAYNYASATAAGARGSGEGLAAMACRTDAFGGTDIPYNDGSLTPATGTMPWLWANIPAANPNNWPYFDPATGEDGSDGCDTFFNKPGATNNPQAYTPPYTPAPNAGCSATAACYPSTANGATNAAAPVMSFPIAVASAALGVNFKPGGTQITGCPTSSSQVQLTPSQVSSIFAGETSNWSQLGSETSFNWTTCNLAITRIVRADISGTTQEMKTYLRSVDGSRALCDGTNTWTTLAQYGNNVTWPGGSADPCSTVTAPNTALGTGGGSSCPATFDTTKGVICDLVITGGGITYGDLPNYKSTPNVLLAQVVPPSGGVAQCPGGETLVSGTESCAAIGTGAPNCDTTFSGNTPGSGGPTDFVGLDNNGLGEPAGTDWATDASNGAGGRVPASDITNIPASGKWPICTLTYDMVYSGESAAAPGGPIGGLTNDQRRTLYTFWRYVLSPDGQNLLRTAGYLPLPSSWASNERTGFIAGF